MSALTLLKWQDEQGRAQEFRLVRKVNANWRILGTLLGFEMAELKSLDLQHRGDATACWMEVMERLLNGGCVANSYPPTWEGVCTLLKDIECASVADQLKRALQHKQSHNCRTSH